MIQNKYKFHNKRHYVDWWLLGLILLLIAYGLLVLYSAGGWVLVKKQLIRLTLGMIVLLFLAQLKPVILA
jgi:rod shape determining protein RodA